MCLFAREDWEAWLSLTEDPDPDGLAWPARSVLEILTTRGAMFPQDLSRASGLLASDLERGLEELISRAPLP